MKNKNTNFVILHRAVIADLRLSDGALRLYCYLLDRRNEKHGGLAWATKKRMAQDLGVSEQTIDNRLEVLAQAGLVISEKMKIHPVSKRRIKGQNRNQYKIVLAEDHYSEDKIKENWVIDESESENLESKKNKDTKTPDSSNLNTKGVGGSLYEQELGEKEEEEQNENITPSVRDTLLSNRFFTNEKITISEEEAEVLLLYESLARNENRDTSVVSYSNKDIAKIRYAINRYDANTVKAVIEYAFSTWDDLASEYQGLNGTWFTLNTLKSDWLDIIYYQYSKYKKRIDQRIS